MLTNWGSLFVRLLKFCNTFNDLYHVDLSLQLTWSKALHISDLACAFKCSSWCKCRLDTGIGLGIRGGSWGLKTPNKIYGGNCASPLFREKNVICSLCKMWNIFSNFPKTLVQPSHQIAYIRTKRLGKHPLGLESSLGWLFETTFSPSQLWTASYNYVNECLRLTWLTT